MPLEPTYELAAGPAVEPFDRYADRLAVRFTDLLSSDPEEAALQTFLLQNPCLVPGLRSLGLKPSAFPVHTMLFSQPRLPGLRERVPDFMWISSTSVACYPTLIEIERPSKKLFTTKRVPSAEFSQARHQLVQWRTWFSRPENVQKFSAEYLLVDYQNRFAVLQPRFLLIFGRRAEFERDAELSQERGRLLDNTTESLTSYDRLEPDPLLHNAITVRPIGNGRYRVLSVPPTLTLGPIDAKRLLCLDGLESAIEHNAEIDPSRRRFLIERIPYWRDWAGRGQGGPFGGVIRSSDRE